MTYTITTQKNTFKRTLCSLLFHDQLTYREQDVLLLLTEYKEITTEVRKTICNETNTSPQYVNNMIKRLKDKGFLKKEGSVYKTSFVFPEEPEATILLKIKTK